MSIDFDVVLFNVSAFICAVFVLDYGADKFVDHTVILAKKLKLSETLIALLTAGAEWEELVVVIAAVLQGKPALAIGNVVGSCISNILGAFSLGLLFRPIEKFDKSARIYALVHLIVTVSVGICLITPGPAKMGKIGGGVLISTFVLYTASIGWGIYRGFVTPPDHEDIDSNSDVESVESIPPNTSPGTSSTDNLLAHAAAFSQKQGERSSIYHMFQIVLGFVALSISGYVLSHAASTLASTFNLSETVVGLTILAVSTTLPEKFVAFMSGWRGHSGILVATTAGSNTFLLTLCIGVALFGTVNVRESLRAGEVGYLIGSAAAFTAMNLPFGDDRKSNRHALILILNS
ncbi:hypothetical protein Clacol_001452 [Clathrus columnatus]|uniref:Sodium/calcium exchanger membrane region domain-containing protein n=1 Tax=Clathrus columnatus TaxID=1419009 RepID=A0AAV5A0Z4_9AGAM|nr:hypothetical protein Clacol_001452 [Clathrus columnatus]